MYDEGYRGRIGRIRAYAESNLQGLQFAGRNGMHKYNNQDHSMVTGLLAAKNIISGELPYPHDAWRVNCDAGYHEEGERLQPKRGTGQ